MEKPLKPAKRWERIVHPLVCLEDAGRKHEGWAGIYYYCRVCGKWMRLHAKFRVIAAEEFFS